MLPLVLFLAAAACHLERPLTGLPREVRDLEPLAPCSVSALPPEVRKSLATLFGEPTLAMADPGQEWDDSCLVVPGVPSRRLAYAAHSGDNWMIHYWQGGFLVTYQVVALHHTGKAAEITWTGYCAPTHGPFEPIPLFSGTPAWRCEGHS